MVRSSIRGWPANPGSDGVSTRQPAASDSLCASHIEAPIGNACTRTRTGPGTSAIVYGSGSACRVPGSAFASFLVLVLVLVLVPSDEHEEPGRFGHRTMNRNPRTRHREPGTGTVHDPDLAS